MKKAITLRLCIVIVLSMLIATVLSYYLQVKSAKEAMYDNSLIRISQVSEIISRNDAEIKQTKKNLEEDYFIRAKAAAYIVQNHPEVIGNLSETKKIASLLRVDELHLFDTAGRLFAGSEPKYFDFTFDSGEQMQFFLPMLDDYSLQLCQEITPNTAEKKQMQYLAVWREDHKGIVQIGMEPVRLLEAMEKSELSRIFTMITAEKGITIFVASPDTGVVMGSTDATLMGENAVELERTISEIDVNDGGFNVEIDGEKNYCVVKQAGGVLVGVSSTYENLYQNIPENMALIIFSLCVLSIVIISLMLTMLDRFIISRIYEIIDGMKKIAAGDLDSHVGVTNLPEFVELSDNINSMVGSLLETTTKLSLVFQNVNIQIAVYEYNLDMKRVLVTSKVGDILMMPDDELSEAVSDRDIFSEKIQQICENPFEEEKNVYVLVGDRVRYVKIKSYEEETKTLGIIVDVTEEILEKQGIKLERDVDILTGLLNRRAYLDEMDRLFQHPENLGIAGLLMVDLDNLKYTNDNWGHECGDELLAKSAKLLKSCKAPRQVVARLSGDEFLLLIYGADSQEEIQGYIDDLYTKMMETTLNVSTEETVPVRMSGGYVFYPEFAKDHRQMLNLADRTMYRVKRGEKGHFEKYQPER